MDEEGVNLFLLTHQKYFTKGDLRTMKQMLMAMQPDERLVPVSLDFKDPAMIIMLSILFGTFGADRFYVGDILLGVLKLITFGCLMIWYVIDWFFIIDRAKRYNYEQFLKYAKSY